MNYLHEELNTDVKHSRRTEYDINDHFEQDKYLMIGRFSSLNEETRYKRGLGRPRTCGEFEWKWQEGCDLLRVCNLY